MHELGYDISAIQAMIPTLTRFVDSARLAGLRIYFTQAVYDSENHRYLSDVWLERAKRQGRGVHLKKALCREGSWGAQLLDILKPNPNDTVLVKHRYSAFKDTELDLLLRSRKTNSIILTGVNTNVCVESTARDAFMMDYYVVVPRDCVASHSKDLHEGSLKNIDHFFGEVADSQAIMKCWK